MIFSTCFIVFLTNILFYYLIKSFNFWFSDSISSRNLSTSTRFYSFYNLSSSAFFCFINCSFIFFSYSYICYSRKATFWFNCWAILFIIYIWFYDRFWITSSMLKSLLLGGIAGLKSWFGGVWASSTVGWGWIGSFIIPSFSKISKLSLSMLFFWGL